jgi:type I restriction enzyme S subunit
MEQMLPSRWKTFKLDKLGSVSRGRSRHRPRNDSSLYGGEYPFFQTGDVKAANLYLSEYSQTYNEIGLAQSKQWEAGTLCITIAANIAETAILGIRGCFPDSVIGYICDPVKADTRFIKYYIDLIKRDMQQVSHGTTQDNLSLDKLLHFNFVVPNVNEQRKIAGILSAYDDLIENNLRRIKILEEMAQNLYREWFVKFRFPGHQNTRFVDSPLGKIPEGWEVHLVEKIVIRIHSGKKYNQKTASATGAIPILDQGRSGIIGYHDDEPGVLASEDRPIIVFANHTCYQNLIMYPFSAIQNVLPFIANSKYLRDIYWLHYTTKDLVTFNDYKGHWPEFISKELILPISYVCKNFGSIVEPILRLIFRHEKRNTNLRQTRDLLLPKLISGEVDVSELEVAITEEAIA